MDAVVVEAVLEARAECSDADRARAALNEALLAARAPTHGAPRPHTARSTRALTPRDGAHWTVTMTVARSEGTAAGAPKSVEAVILDDAGIIVAQRTLSDRSARACLPLARAVGAWASLVLDAEMNRAKDDDGQEAPKAATGGASPSSSRGNQDPSAALGREGSIRDVASEPVAKEPPRTFELGTMVYLRNGMTSTGGVAGLAPFVTVEVWPGWVLRPGLFFGRSTSRLPVVTERPTPGGEQSAMVSHLGARADLCRRIPGNYIERRGIELDVCGGFEGGTVRSDGPSGGAARFGFGPSANLRGELGGGLALEVRGLLGANLVNTPLASEPNAPLVFAAGELGVSMRLP